MRARLIAVASFVAIAACKSDPAPPVAAPATTVASPVSEESLLLCRGGAPASVSSRLDLSGPARAVVNGQPSDYLAGLIIADMTVVKQAGSAGKNGIFLDPGSCAYPNRGMFESEPHILRHYRHDTPAVVSWTTRDGTSNPVIVRTFFDEFAADSSLVIRVRTEPEKDRPEMSRMVEWWKVPRE